MADTVRIAVTGAAGQIGYALVFRIASGQLLGENTPVSLRLLEIPPAMDAVRGVIMEVEDCAFPLLDGITATDDANVAFDGADIAILVGARPRSAGMERGDLLEANAAIFSAQGAALNNRASRDAKVLVVGNPANTNCLIAQRNAPNLDPRNFTAMMRLDHNRAKAQLAAKTGAHVDAVRGLVVWGNHSATQYPDLHHTTVAGKSAMELVDHAWYADEFIPTVQQRGAAIIAARGASSAASAANAIIEHIGDWVSGADDVVSMGVYSDGSYGIETGLIYSFPVRCADGDWQVIDGLDISDFSRQKMRATEAELQEERDAVAHLLP